jgi:hypothetical protein
MAVLLLRVRPMLLRLRVTVVVVVVEVGPVGMDVHQGLVAVAVVVAGDPSGCSWRWWPSS